MSRLVLGTRGSALARAQTLLVETGLRAAWSELEIEVEIINTRGDETGDLKDGRKGLFTGEIERALLSGEIDVAVHSAKDLPSDARAGLEICAALPRAAAEDVLVMKTAADFATLPAGAVVATGSVRRQHQLRWLRADVTIQDLRGNVPTRLRKLIAESWDAIILARAGLERLGFDCACGAIDFEGHALRAFILPTDQFTPAGGQGIVALQIRNDDAETRVLIEKVNHHETLLCLRAEREFLRLLQGDCGTPVGVLATIAAGLMELRGQLFDEGKREPISASSIRNPLTREPELVAALLFSFINAKK